MKHFLAKADDVRRVYFFAVSRVTEVSDPLVLVLVSVWLGIRVCHVVTIGRSTGVDKGFSA